MANTLGAPTEGLGQNITFAPPGAGQAPQLSLDLGQQAVQSGVSGGPAGVGGTRGQGVQGEAYRNPILDTLIGLAGAGAKARIQAAKSEAYVAGMQRASTGEAVAEIAADQPWYATMFGDTDVVEGARWYAGHTVAQETANSFDEEMQELRRLPPEQARSEFTSRIQSRLTGDAKTDATILQSMTQVMPSIFKRHAKEHVGFLNEEAATAMSASTLAASQRLQTVAKFSAKDTNSPGYGPAELKVALGQFLQANTKPPGMDEKTFREIKLRNLEHTARQGNFHAIQVLEASGFISALPVEDQDKFRAIVDKQEDKAALEFRENNVELFARIEAQRGAPKPGTGADLTGALIAEANEKYQKQTGARRPVISGDRAAALLSGTSIHVIQAQEREHDRRLALERQEREAGDKAAADATLFSAARLALVDNQLQQFLAKPDVQGKKGQIMAGFTTLYHTQQTPEARAAVALRLSDNNALKESGIQDHLVGRITRALGSSDNTTGVLSNEMAAEFREYSALRKISAPAAIAAYGEYGPRLDRWYRDKNEANMPEGQAFMGFLQSDSKRAKLDRKEFTQVVKQVGEEINPKLFGVLPVGISMHPSSAAFISNLLEDGVARSVGANTPLELAVKSTLRKARGDGNLNYIGGFAWLGDKAKTTPFMDYLTGTEGPSKTRPLGTDNVHELFHAALHEKLGASNLEDGQLWIEQLPDKNGVPSIAAHWSHRDGTNRQVNLSGDEVFVLSDQRTAKAKTGAQLPQPVPAGVAPVNISPQPGQFFKQLPQR